MIDRLGMLRTEIDALDAQLVRLIGMRLSACEKIAQIKRKAGLPTQDATREQAVVDGALSRVRAPEHRPYVERYVREMMALCRDYQDEIRKGEK